MRTAPASRQRTAPASPAADRTREPAADRAREPAADRAREPAADRTREPAADRTREPAADRTREPAADRAREPAADRTREPAADRTREPAADRAREPAADRAREPAADRAREPAAYRDEDFPGCESFHLPAGEVDHYEGRLEFWDGDTETAWKVCEPTSIYHEKPSRRLGRMAERVASLRGSPVESFGSADLLRVDATGRKHWLMQADEVLYLHPDRVRLAGPAIDVDADPLPDVVLEVDHTTDVRKRKLGIYMESGFPEVWVLVPWEASVRRPGLTIHVRRGEGYREEPESRAFPGWRAEEIHRALTESPLSETAWRALERVALSMGAREGTRPEDDPLMGSHSAKVRAKGRREGHREGHAEGRREGRAEGHREGRAEGRREGHAEGHREGHVQGHREGLDRGRGEMLAANVLTVLKARGIAVAPDLTELRALLGASSSETVMEAALACADAADLRRRLAEQGAGPLSAGGPPSEQG